MGSGEVRSSNSGPAPPTIDEPSFRGEVIFCFIEVRRDRWDHLMKKHRASNS